MDLCNRCLIQVNAMTWVVARVPRDDGLIDLNTFQYPTDPQALKEWAEDVLSRGGVIDMGNTRGHFAPFSTWHGDPVCVIHLQLLVDLEMRTGYGARALRTR